jgi:tRNA (guanine9-N1)-methyltransferase
VSLCSQLAYTYSANRQASFPFSLIYSSLNGRTFKRLESVGDAGYKRWTNAKWWSEGYSRLWENSKEDIPQLDTETGSTDGEKQDSSSFATTSTQITRDNAPKNTVIYLTADSEDELSELRPDKTYIIGGICDHNRYKVTFFFFSFLP